LDVGLTIPHCKNTSLLQKVIKSLGPGWILWINDLSGGINTNTETLVDASKEVGREIRVEKIKYMLLHFLQNAGHNWDIKITNRSFENVSQFKYLGTSVTNQNVIQEEINRRLSSGNDCYHSIWDLLSSHLLSENIKIRIYRTIILLVVLHGSETCSLTLRD
jgi:hypothetical protein